MNQTKHDRLCPMMHGPCVSDRYHDRDRKDCRCGERCACESIRRIRLDTIAVIDFELTRLAPQKFDTSIWIQRSKVRSTLTEVRHEFS